MPLSTLFGISSAGALSAAASADAGFNANVSDYLVHIVQSSTNTNISAPMPDSFSYDSASDYQAPFSQGIFGNSNVSSILKVMGTRLTTQAFTAQIWQGSTETSLSLELEFHTETDVINDVKKPMLQLLALSTADVNNNLLVSPGPSLDQTQAVALAAAATKFGITALKEAAEKLIQATLSDATSVSNGSNKPTPDMSKFPSKAELLKTIKNNITIQIGRYAYFDSVVITNVQKTYSTQPDALTGWPHHAKVRVDFRPLFLVVRDDLKSIFNDPKGEFVRKAK